jgi:cell fate regulator YaaT (PSP1 superfamily)
MQLKKNKLDENSPEIKKIIRRATERDIEAFHISKGREKDILARSRAAAMELKLQMKLSEVEIQADGKKATFFYTADDRVDFREPTLNLKWKCVRLVFVKKLQSLVALDLAVESFVVAHGYTTLKV